jgi:hypothetical protein
MQPVDPRSKKRRRLFNILGAVLFVLVVAAVLVPHNLVSHLAKDEISAVKTVRALKDLEQQYAATHPSNGFTCDLALLKPALSDKEQIHEGLLFSEGYKFSLAGCEPGSDGVAVRFKAAAIPVKPGETGVRTFCIDQTGRLQYALDGSPENCQPI